MLSLEPYCRHSRQKLLRSSVGRFRFVGAWSYLPANTGAVGCQLTSRTNDSQDPFSSYA